MTDAYTQTAYRTSRLFTNDYSTSFSLSSRLFAKSVRPHIYAIYGLTRLADEIVDSYHGNDAAKVLDNLEAETYHALTIGYSANPIVQAFQTTSREFAITKTLIQPFFASMRQDLTRTNYNRQQYQTYIYGSAEVVGLMCLKVFCAGDQAAYQKFHDAAAKLGAAYQKVNFLRDLQADQQELGRYYFPDSSFKSFDEADKQTIIAEIRNDFQAALPGAQRLPKSARRAVMTSYRYYSALLRKLERTPATTIKQRRVRINNGYKVLLLVLPIARKWS